MKLGLFLLAALLLFIMLYLPFSAIKPGEITWGVTFSQKMSEELGLDWQANYRSIIDDLTPSSIRLIAYWDKIEPEENAWQFRDLDWQIDEAAKANIPIILAIGRKAPRWPECHDPSWASKKTGDEYKDRLRGYIAAVVERYKSNPSLLYWQVENEPFIGFGDCGRLTAKQLDEEIALVRQLDPQHKILTTDGGAWGGWFTAAKRGDAFGTTLYTKVYRKGIGYTHPPFPPAYYGHKRNIIRFLTGKKDQPFIFTEIGLEPWGGKSIAQMSLEEQQSLHSLKDFRQTIDFAKQTGFDTYYLWGAEWWYAAKLRGATSYWEEARYLFHSGKQSTDFSKRFPPGFLWGASTSAHQVEGTNHNDWTEWEKTHADALAQQAESTLKESVPDWEAIKTQAQDPQNYISGQAADEYNRYSEDFDLAKSLGMNAQRISLEWSRIEPREGEFDQQELDHYKQEIKDLKNRGMEPFVTLWHYTLPTWFADQGGWLNPKSADQFAVYTQTVMQNLGGDVKFWITINEPGVYSSNAYLLGVRPPQHKNPLNYLLVLRRLGKAHKQAYRAIKSTYPSSQVGIAQDAYSFQIGNWPHFWLAKRLARWWANVRFLDGIQKNQDFIGLNYYINVPIGSKTPNNAQVSDLGWKLSPEGMYAALQDMKRYRVPIYITENGLADAEDKQRSDYIKAVVAQVYRAIQGGVDVRGYFHWSLIDNFEWEKGFWPRFGLIAVDYATQKRTIRPSAYDYAEIIKNNGLIK